MIEITCDALKGSYSEGEAQNLYHRLQQNADFMAFARQFMHDTDYQVARNALWVLTKASDPELSSLQPMLHELIDLALSTDNSSVRRLSLNIIERLDMSEEDLRTDFLDFCLDHMADVNEYPGIQSLCMKLAHRMAGFYPELMEELLRTIEAMEMDYYKPAVRSVVNRIKQGKPIRKRKV